MKKFISGLLVGIILPSYRYAKEIAEENLAKFKDKADAESKGYEPYGVCRP